MQTHSKEKYSTINIFVIYYGALLAASENEGHYNYTKGNLIKIGNWCYTQDASLFLNLAIC